MAGAGRRGGARAWLAALAIMSCTGEVDVDFRQGGTGGAGLEGMPTAQVQATVNSLQFEELVLEDDRGRRYYLAVGPHTLVTIDGRAGSLLSLKTGSSVEAEYVNANGDLRATRIKVETGRP